MITLRQRVFIIVSIVIAILLAILLYVLFGPKQKISGTTQTSTGKTTTSTDTVNFVPNNTVQTETNTLPPYSEDLYVRQLAKIFVERFGSTSSQKPNQNISDSLELASPTMQTWLTGQQKEATRDYVGQVTEVLASRLGDKTATTATVLVETQQTVEQKKDGAMGATNKEIIQKKGRVTLVKVGESWLIDGLYWDT